ncbi:MAG TPA: FAD-dependent monooxygenase [Microlunatus sp.]|nr:FAD-dependent monooxygenase [Microlunatus sp.]
MKPEATDQQYDAIVVGARCAGATVATVLAGAGGRVLLVDRDTFPSDTVSTHQLFPDSLELLDRLGAGDRLRAAHRLRPVGYSWRVLGQAVAGAFSPIGGHDRTCSIRRVSLDAALVDTAAAAGAELRLGAQVEELIGAGTDDDPVRGVVLRGGERLPARWVIGADGRTSTVARRLQLSPTEPRRGEMSMLFAYWEGLPDPEWCQIDVHESLALMSAPCEDGLHLLSVNGPADLTRGSATERQEKYLAALRRFPTTLNPRLLEQGQQISPVIAVPETMLRGFVRPASGPGWALVGDAGLFKHPVTANGIGDALAHGWYVGNALSRGDDLVDYGAWRDERSAGHYDFSFETARFPAPGSAAVYQGLAEDSTAGQEFLDLFVKRHRPAEVLTENRLARWRAAWAYAEGVDTVCSLLEGLDDEALETVVPACPDWRVRDLLAHLVGVAEDSADGGYFADAMDAWRTPAHAAAREAWTAGHVDRHRHRTRDDLVGRLSRYGSEWAGLLRRGTGLVDQAPAWLVAAPAADLSVHLVDLTESIGKPAESGSAISRFGFAAYRRWLGQRLIHQQLPALLFSDGRHDWPVGRGAPAGTVTAPADELFRMITGRRSWTQIQRYDWSVDPTPYLAVISPYPLPT